jgi:hypothetical protein
MTKKQVGIFIVFFPIVLSAQKEIFFGDNIPKAVPVKMVRGVETRITVFPTGDDYTLLSPINSLNSATYLGYFSETVISEDWTLYKSIGFQLVNYKTFSWQSKHSNDPTSRYPDIVSSSSASALELLASAEPRYYLETNQENSQHNSGLYWSFPCLLQAILLHTPQPTHHKGWFPTTLYYDLSVSPSLGIRQAISKQIFCEFSAGILFSFREYPTYCTVLEPMFQLRLARFLSR